MQDFEKLGNFYLGKIFDQKKQVLKEEPLLYDSKDLTTHGVCVGMTGSGKTGLAISLLEEAAIDGIPAIVIDPKGDMGNLLLRFPELKPEDFLPWLDEGEAIRKGLTIKEYSKKTATTWKNGLKEWGQDGLRIQRYKDAAEILIYTPGSNAGIPVNVLRSFNAPGEQVLADRDAMKEIISGTATSVLSLLGIDADPIQSREHILISKILADSWGKGKNLEISDLIRHIQSPVFTKIGVFDIDTFFPVKDRMKLAMSLNNLLASPGFEVWMEGVALDINRFLYTTGGKPKISVFSISHLSDTERMFFVSLLLNEMVSWMRTQDGTSSLRALLYMDEIYGYFPPTASPPSKTPMLTLLKQARAFGLGVLLSTQNPVDLDYKGLSNAGTWFIGRLQTDRDKQRMLDGLEGVNGDKSLSRSELDNLISSLGKRKFLMHNVHESAPAVFNTRWVLSYLRGPLTSRQIQSLMKNKTVTETEDSLQGKNKISPAESKGIQKDNKMGKPLLPPGITEKFRHPEKPKPEGSTVFYKPEIFCMGKLHYVSAKARLDHWKDLSIFAGFPEESSFPAWDEAEYFENSKIELDKKAIPSAKFKSLPKTAAKVRNYSLWKKSLITYLYQSEKIKLWNSPLLKEISRPGETEAGFRIRLNHLMHEKRDLMLEKMRKKYAPKLERLETRLNRALEKVEKEETQYNNAKYQTMVSMGSTLLGAIFGRKLASAGNIGKATTSMRGVGRAAREKRDVNMAKREVEEMRDQLAEMELESKLELDKIRQQFTPDSIELNETSVSPRKSDISLSNLILVWEPFYIDSDGFAEKAI